MKRTAIPTENKTTTHVGDTVVRHSVLTTLTLVQISQEKALSLSCVCLRSFFTWPASSTSSSPSPFSAGLSVALSQSSTGCEPPRSSAFFCFFCQEIKINGAARSTVQAQSNSRSQALHNQAQTFARSNADMFRTKRQVFSPEMKMHELTFSDFPSRVGFWCTFLLCLFSSCGFLNFSPHLLQTNKTRLTIRSQIKSSSA